MNDYALYKKNSDNIDLASACLNIMAVLDVMLELWLMFHFQYKPPHPSVTKKRALFWITVTVLILNNVFWAGNVLVFEIKELVIDPIVGGIVLASLVFFRLNLFIYWLLISYSPSSPKQERSQKNSIVVCGFRHLFSTNFPTSFKRPSFQGFFLHTKKGQWILQEIKTTKL